MATPRRLRVAVALEGAGWHPGAWRLPSARPRELLSARYWADLVQEAEAGLVDLVTIEDGLALQADDPWDPDGDARTDRVRGRLDALLIASRVAPHTRHIGLVPSVDTTHTEPFHVSKAVATLDFVSQGRAGVRVQVAPRPREAALLGRRDFPALRPDDLASAEGARVQRDAFEEAADHVEVQRRLWDSWEDDAEIRDVATGRFIDRDRLHHIDFQGRFFDVKGPSITPRPPQGQPIVAALAHAELPYRLIGTSADLGLVTPQRVEDVAGILERIRSAQDDAGRGGETVHVFGELLVVLGATTADARQRLADLDGLAGLGRRSLRSDAAILAGTTAEVADLLEAWVGAGLTGVRLRPAALPDDLTAITRTLVPELQRRGLFHDAYEAATLRGLLGLSRPADRYATL